MMGLFKTPLNFCESNRNRYLILFTFTLIMYFVAASGRLYSYDGQMMFAMTRTMVDKHSIVISEEVGHKYSKYGPLQSVLATPLYATGKLLKPILVKFAPSEIIDEWFLGMFNILVTAVTLIVIAAAAAELGVGAWGATVTALLWGFTTMAWPYSKMDFSEPLLTLCVMLTLFYGFRAVRLENARYAFIAGIFLGFSVLTKYVNIMTAPIFFLAILGSRQGRWKRAVSFFVPVTISVALMLAFNYARFGSILDTGYDLSSEYRQNGSFVECAYGILLSSGKSIFIYSPPLILALIGLGDFLKKNRMFAFCIGASFLFHITLYSWFSSWGGGLSWGPRYFLPFVGMGMWMAAPFITRAFQEGEARWRRWLVITMAIAGLAIQSLAVSVRMNTVYENGSVDVCLHQRMYGPSESEDPKEMPLTCGNPIAREWKILRMRAPRMLRLGVAAIRGELNQETRDKKYENTYLDFWAAYLLPRLPQWAIFSLAVLMCGFTTLAFLLLFFLFRGMHHPYRYHNQHIQ